MFMNTHLFVAYRSSAITVVIGLIPNVWRWDVAMKSTSDQVVYVLRISVSEQKNVYYVLRLQSMSSHSSRM